MHWDVFVHKEKMEGRMNLEERIKKGKLFYESGHKSLVNQEIERKLDKERRHCKERMFDYNHCRPNDQKNRQTILKELLGSCGNHVFIEDGLHMSYGSHVYLEDYFYANFNLTIIDDGEVHIGDRTMIGPNVTICTTGHPVNPMYRKMAAHYSLPIHIGKNVWIGSNSVILPGVVIGDNTVIGAGSIVTRNIPENVVAVGNPCKILRSIGERDKIYYFRDLKVDEPYTSRLKDE